MISPVSPLTKALSALDNEGELWPLFVKDILDSTGRTVMEYKRGGHGANHAGRERLIEEFATTGVWVWGRKAVTVGLLYPLMRLSKIALDPKTDVALFLKEHQNTLFQHIPQWIQQKKSRYFLAHITQFIIATVVPIFVIGWIIPRINQAITRRALQQERQQALPVQHVHVTRPMEKYHPGQELLHGQVAYKLKRPALNLQSVKQAAPPPAMPNHQLPWWTTASLPQVYNMPYRPAFTRFGSSLAEKIVNITTNDFFGNVFVDVGFVSGRLYNARNWADRTEVGIREGSVIVFLYFLGDYIKGKLRRFFDHNLQSVTQLSYDSLAWLKSTLKANKPISNAMWQKDMAFLKETLPQGKQAFETIARKLNPLTGQFDHNPLLELARKQGKIHIASASERLPLDTFRQLFGETVSHPHHRYILDPRKVLDLDNIYETLVQSEHVSSWQKLSHKLLRTSKPIAQKEMGIIPRLIQATEGKPLQSALEACLKRSYRYKSLAMLSSYVISCLGVGILAPKLQHWVTKELTGTTDFPGVRHHIDPTLHAFQKSHTHPSNAVNA